jgi:hypothetical protein
MPVVPTETEAGANSAHQAPDGYYIEGNILISTPKGVALYKMC